MKNDTGKNSIIMLAADTLTADEIAKGTADDWKGVRYEKQIAIFGDYVNPLNLIVTGKDRKSTRLNSSHRSLSRMPSSA